MNKTSNYVIQGGASNNKNGALKVLLAGLVLLMLVFFAFVVGAGVGVGAYFMIAPLILIFPAIYLLLRPDISLGIFAGLTLLVSGSLKFFLGLGQFQWALSALGVALLAYALVSSLFAQRQERSPATRITHVMLLWWACLIFASAANTLPVLDWFVGLRIYLPFFGIFAYVAYCRPKANLLKGILLFMLAIASVQWVFCLYQKLQIVPMRMAAHYPGSPWDSIVGSFGGEKYGVGESGSLGIYLSIIIALAAALFKYKQLKLFPFVAFVLFSLAAVAMVEAKVIVLMIPLACFFVYRDYILKQPLKFLMGTVAIAVLMLGLLYTYYFLYWSEEVQRGFIATIMAKLGYSFDPYFRYSSNALGRIGSLVFWWNKHGLLDNPLTLLIGHGLASAVSSSSIIGEGVAVHQYGYRLDETGAAKLLWESGLLGIVFFLLMFVIGFFRARHLKNDPNLPPWHRAAMSGVEAAMVLIPLSIFYEVTAVSSPPMQFFAMFLLGYIAYWWRETAGVRSV